MHIKRGDVIESPRWEEPIEVIIAEPNGDDYLHLSAVTVNSRRYIDQIIRIDELNQADVKKLEDHFTADPQDVFLALEAKRYRYADLYDPLLAMNSSKVDPLPHQIEAVYGHVLKLPRITAVYPEMFPRKTRNLEFAPINKTGIHET
jgi:hypothetical protein